MILKKIDIQGFKSFPDKIDVTFKEGITAIVGPNGSGKSNISDAIRWVLGEQSVKNLRGRRMEDVIFAGTGKRKALGYAEVTITFDNKSGDIPVDYEEVAITRRMFRSGESEYYLNKNSCRLRDIRELFMDTGIGKDGYSIVGQGRIDEILSNRPEDRRNIFEEAAGIVRYKTKKEEAERKLKKTQENLIRIKDLIHELSNQSDLLEEQAKKAEKFSELFNRLKELEVNIFLQNIRVDNKKIEEINSKTSELKKELETKIINKANIEKSFNSIKTNTEKLDREIDEYRKTEMDTVNDIDRSKNQINILQEKKGFYHRDLERIKNEKENLIKKLDTLSKQDLGIEEDILKYEKEYDELLDDYNIKSKNLAEQNKKNKLVEEGIEEAKDNIMEIYNKLSSQKSELNSINSFNENIDKRTIQLNKEIEEMEERKGLNLEAFENSISSEEKLKAEESKLRDRIKDLRKTEANLKQREEEINQKTNAYNAKLQGKTSNLKLFKNMEASYEGYYRGVKSILRAAKVNKELERGLLGVVAELIKVDEKFEKAIDTALGSNAQNLVTKREEDAKKIIEYLRDNKLGRITCLPLNVIRGNVLSLSTSDREEFGILGLGSEIIEYQPKYKEIIRSLLGRTIIVENIDYGIKLANKYNHSHRIVTLNGEVLNPGGSMTGGSYASNSISIINRKNRINRLENKIIEYKNNLAILLKEKEQIVQEILNNGNNIKKSEEDIKKIEYEIIKVNNNKENKKNEIARLDEGIKRFKNEISILQREINDHNIKSKDLDKNILELENKSERLKEEIRDKTKIFNEEKSYIEDINTIVTDMKINLNKKENKIKNLQERLRENKLEINTLKSDRQNKKESILLNQKEIELIEENTTKLIKLIEKQEEIRVQVRERLNHSINKKEKLMDSFYSEQENLKAINNEITELERLKNSQEVQLARVTVQLENYYKKLQEDYELSYEEALKQEVDIGSIKEAIVESRKLKVGIKELGNVNLSSIEEYKKLSSRLNFITSQQKDLTKAKEDLNKVISDMEEKMKKQFLISFEEINGNFKEIFKILFDGGKAELILEEGEDILNTGIEIKAQPPGKRLQSLSLLSGGEKSLTAVALLFSILKMKPAPFCVLDEIDAALDEANIGRYTNYLKTYCQDTQFIMITHRKTTMEMADVLYGVTMEEQGISKLISVELKDDMGEKAS